MLCSTHSWPRMQKLIILNIAVCCRVHSNGAFPFTKIRRHIFLQRERKRLRETGASWSDDSIIFTDNCLDHAALITSLFFLLFSSMYISTCWRLWKEKIPRIMRSFARRGQLRCCTRCAACPSTFCPNRAYCVPRSVHEKMVNNCDAYKIPCETCRSIWSYIHADVHSWKKQCVSWE